MTAAGNILAGARATAAMLQGIAPDAAVKPADETVTNSATLQNDNDLFENLPATGTFAFLAMLLCVSTAAQGSADIKVGVTWPAGATTSWSTIANAQVSGGTASMGPVRSASGLSISCGVGTVEVPVLVMGTITMGGTIGDLQLQFAQATAVSGNSITVKQGSWLMAWQIA